MDFNIGEIALWFVAFIFSLCFHELAHAWTSEKFGDDTGRYQGRITMDPRAHIDPLGTIVLPLFSAITHVPMFGWAKPVEVNPSRWKNKVLANIAVSAAGPGANLLLAGISVLVIKLLKISGMLDLESAQTALLGSSIDSLTLLEGFVTFLWTMIVINLVLAAFNMLPIPPLDGSHILSSLLSVISPKLMEMYESLRPFGFFILLAFCVTGLSSRLMSPIVNQLARVLLSIL